MQAVAAILRDNHGVVRMREHRSLRSAVWRLARQGYLKREFPGVYVRADAAPQARQWLAALTAWKPDAVITGEVAFALATDQLPELAAHLPPVVLHRARETRNSRRCQFKRRTLDPGHVALVRGIRLHHPVVAAVEAAATDSGNAIDHLLRKNSLDPASLPNLVATHWHCPGNARRRAVVQASRTRPYSTGERELHRLLTRAGITGWVANRPLRIGGRTIIPDGLFPEIGLILEFDGRRFHGPEQFETDRERHNLLVSHGYTVLRVTWKMVTERPQDVVATIRRTRDRLRNAATLPASG